MVKLQYSGAEGGLVRGIAVVNLVHTSGEDGEYYPVDFRIYAKEADGKSKNDHFQEMLLRAVGDKQIQAKTVLFDSWYGSWQNLKLIHRLGLTFYTTLKGPGQSERRRWLPRYDRLERRTAQAWHHCQAQESAF